MNALAGKFALVTGAGSGIGHAVVTALATQGVNVVLVGRTLEKLEEVRSKLTTTSWAYAADVTNETSLRSLTESLVKNQTPIDMLIHSAGVIRPGLMSDAAPGDFEFQFRTNCWGPYFLTQLLLPTIRSRRGQITFINSSAGITARAGVSQYAATKHALKAMADSLREEVNRDGVRVLSVYCGRTATPMQEQLQFHEGRSYVPDVLIQPEDIATMILAALSLPPTAEVTDFHIRPLQPLRSIQEK